MAKVRSAIVAMLALAACAVASAPAASAQAPESQESGPRVVIAVLPYGSTVDQIARVGDFAPGLVSAGLGPVPIAQTWLDTSQGNRVNENLYERKLGRVYLRDGRVPVRVWERTVERAEGAPSTLVPGLLAQTLIDAGMQPRVEADSGAATLMAVDEQGATLTVPSASCRAGCGPGLSVVRARLGELAALDGRLGEDDLLIAIAAGQRSEQQLLPTGIRGPGFETGNLTSSSTRTDGIFSTIDLAPTVLEHLGVEVPDEMGGDPVEVGGERDPAGVAELQDRLESRPSRDTVVLFPVFAWLLLAAIARLAGGRRAGALAFRLFGLACTWGPLTLLLTELVGAGDAVATALFAGGAPLLALATERLAPGMRGLAIACFCTVAAYAVDVVLGSQLTSLSILGPNPGAGTRFFGIGNELEALLTPMTLVGAGAWLASRRELARPRAAIWFLVIAAVAAAAFAPGRFGADVGAAIVLGVGAATAVAVVLRLGLVRALLLIVAAGVVGLAALLAVDALLGGAHLSRSVLGAGDTGDLLDVFERRLRLMVHTFTPPRYPVLFGIVIAMLVAGALKRRSISAWFGDAWPARAGFAGAVAGVLVGTVANDSGAVLLVLGTIYLGAAAAFFWGTGPAAQPRRPGG